MTAARTRTIPLADDDAAISAAVASLMGQRDESVVDLAHYTKMSVASLYRKLGGENSWKASDVGRLARHFGVLPGDLFTGIDVLKIGELTEPYVPVKHLRARRHLSLVA